MQLPEKKITMAGERGEGRDPGRGVLAGCENSPRVPERGRRTRLVGIGTTRLGTMLGETGGKEEKEGGSMSFSHATVPHLLFHCSMFSSAEDGPFCGIEYVADRGVKA